MTSSEIPSEMLSPRSEYPIGARFGELAVARLSSAFLFI
jgi:hypothetical protein